ncbi:MAG: bifunctional DNA-binding transcriptional regulator/O6-methylguanine-DNA methyltransferase Ada [Candidatus Contendobacter sp.]|nr:bifunctional DNA-binding transcriptional regulator/O6-methylguanine-DNA methyltransferase Ada [Candidatus Contendobacter sp.]
MQYITDPAFESHDQRWDALVQRDRQADGAFFYAVKTTGVYCRPICSARRPNRNNVEFFSSSADAEQAGYRACRRCRPQQASNPSPMREAIGRACAIIEDAEEAPSLTELAAAVGFSPFHFQRLFKKALGVTPKAYAVARRVRRFQEGLREDRTVTQAMVDAGFRSSSRCYEEAADHLGMTPSEYRNGGAGKGIRYTMAECRLGWLLVAATERGICAIEFGDHRDELQNQLGARFPFAEFHGDDPGLSESVASVLEFLDRPDRGLDLPLDVRGTAFQRRVWEALRAVPPGSTVTYAEIARKIGHPAAARAVAGACAANPVAIAIPCHRIVRGDGGLGGYRWDLRRKRALLEREAAQRTEREESQAGTVPGFAGRPEENDP